MDRGLAVSDQGIDIDVTRYTVKEISEYLLIEEETYGSDERSSAQNVVVFQYGEDF